MKALLVMSSGRKEKRGKKVSGIFHTPLCNLANQTCELFDGDLGGADYAAEGSSVEFVMLRYGDRRPGWTHQPHMAAFLTKDRVTELRQGSDAGRSGDDGERRHGQAATLTSTTS
jgi:hypothetical protein